MRIIGINISNIISTCLLSVSILANYACQDSNVIYPGISTVNSDEITVTGTLTINDPSIVRSRGGFGQIPGAGLKLTLLEFDKGATADLTTISNSYQAEITSATAVDNGVNVNFKVTLLHTESPKVLHLIVADDYVSISGYGSEASILPSLIVGTTNPETNIDETEAYWGCVDFPKGYSVLKEEETEEGTRAYYELLPEVKTKLTAVPVIRNFSMITVSVDSSVDNFELLGFDVVNVPTAGTIAPWNAATQSIPALLDNGVMKDYTTLMSDSDPYLGILAPGALIRNQESDAKLWNETNHPSLNDYNPVYMYEHPYESTRRTYLIVRGTYTPDSENATPVTGYYKLDIGNMNVENNTFDYYNIIRNIHYNVRIKEVNASGMSSVGEAIARAPYNNLVSATETSSMLNVSDGKNMLIVNSTSHMIVNTDKTIDVMYRYIKNVTGTHEEANGVPTVVGLSQGDVVKSWTEDTYTDPSGSQWVILKIVPNAPTNVVKTQSFSIVDGNGLGRVINLVLRLPWQYASMGVVDGENVYATVASGANNLYSQIAPQDISNQANKELTVYFNLPDGLPESIFPLNFQLEAYKQGIENNKIGTLVVQTGASLFPDKANQTVISYIKTVSYLEYCYKYKAEGSNDVDVSDSNRNTNHTVRCRFTTINEVANGDETEILIHNGYFTPNASVKFKRVAGL